PSGVTEGSPVVFTVSLSAASGQVVMVNYTTASGSAVVGTNFVFGSGTLTFNPGVVTQTIPISTLMSAVDDTTVLNFTVTLASPTNATISAATGTGMIIDGTPPLGTSITIAGGATYTNTSLVALNLSATNASMMYITADNSCSSGGVYEAYSPTKSYSLSALNQTAFVAVKYKDAFGNVSACISDSIIHDNIPPTTPSSFVLQTPASSPGVVLAPILRVTGLTVGDTVQIHSSPACLGTALTSAGVTAPNMNMAIPALPGDGTYLFYANALDPATNSSSCLGPLSYQVLTDLTDDDGTLLGFGGGGFFDTSFTGPEVMLSGSGITNRYGEFTSRVMDGTQSVSWLSMQWLPSFPTSKPLPNFNGMEMGYPYGNADMSNNRLLYHFEENFYSGAASEVIDTSGTGSSGSAQSFTSSGPGVYGSGVQFTSGRGAISVPHNGGLNFSGPFAIETWVKPSSVVNAQSSDRMGLVDKGFFSLGINSRAEVQFDVQTTSGSGSGLYSKNFTAGHDSIPSLIEFHGALYAGAESAGSSAVDVYACVPATDGTCTTWNTSYSSSSVSAARAMIVFKDTLYVGFGSNAASSGAIRFCTTETTGAQPGYCDGSDWSQGFDGINMQYVNAFAVFKNRLYAAFVLYTGATVLKVCDPTLSGATNICDGNTDWTDAVIVGTSPFTESYNSIYSMAVMGDNLYIGMGGASATGDVFMCATADGVCNSPAEWTKSYNSSTAVDTVTSMLEMNGALYFGFQSSTVATIRRCDPKAAAPFDQCTSGDGTTLLYTATSGASVESMATFGGKLYVGLGWLSATDGRYLVFDPITFGSPLLADPADVSGPMPLMGGSYNSIPAIYAFNQRLYFGTAGNAGSLFGDIIYLDRFGASVKSGRKFLSSTEWNHVVAVYTGFDIRVYINSVFEGSTPMSGTLFTSSTPMSVGKYIGATGDNSTSTAFVGQMDELAIYDRALNPAEVWERYHRGATRLQIEVRSCANPSCSDGIFVGPFGTPGTSFTEELSSILAPILPQSLFVPNNRYFQYRVKFWMDSGATNSPGLRSVVIDNSN
ncbi:MAG: hypothetical protein K2X47_11030, partial [Bdellovibrionales bacterium]|nr:hypothetical protein [Bdellovibrionales bacterium]